MTEDDMDRIGRKPIMFAGIALALVLVMLAWKAISD
jgi:hypothetical protein